MKHFFSSLPKNFITCFTGYNLVWNFLAVAATYLLVKENIDWEYFVNTRYPLLDSVFHPAIVIGGILPIILPLVLIFAGHALQKKKIIFTGWALGQAALLGSLISSLYKAFTGRIQPNLHDIATNISSQFQFGFLKHGIFWGWPSSHTTIAFAMAFTLIALYPTKKKIITGSILYAFYIGIGVSLSIHWFSDFIAGAILGTVIGLAVANSFEKRMRSTKN